MALVGSLMERPLEDLHPGRILIIKWGALGDLIAGTTAIRAVRRRYPDVAITILANSTMREICPQGTLADEIIEYEPNRKSISYQIGILRELRKRKFDLSINLRWTSERSALLGFLSGANLTAGSGPRESRWAYNRKAPLYEGRRHEYHRHLDILEPLGITGEIPEPFVFVSDEDRSFAKEIFQRNEIRKDKVLAIHPGASLSSKAWLPERFTEVGKLFVKKEFGKVLVTWGPGEERLAEEVSGQIGSSAICSPRTSIGKLAALLERCGLCICNYSGVMNVGMATKTPLLALGCTSAEDWGPLGDLHRTINHGKERDSYTNEERAKVMAMITVEEVWEALGRRWNQLYGGASGQ